MLRRLTPVLQLLSVVLSAVLVPAWVCRSSGIAEWLKLKDPKKPRLTRVMPASGGIQDAASGHAVLHAHQPRWVMVGNSMLNCRIDTETFSRQTGLPLYKLSISATRSAMWFLMLKRIVAESGVQPKLVTLFFSDRDLTWPEIRVNSNAAMIDRLDGRDLPEWGMVLGSHDLATGRWLTDRLEDVEQRVLALFPAERLRDWARSKIQKTAFDLTQLGFTEDYNTRRKHLNAAFSLERQRPRKTRSDPTAGDEQRLKRESFEWAAEPVHFEPSPEASFLPHMVAIAKRHGFVLHLHRIKVNPAIDDPDEHLPAYLADLQVYLAQQGCLYSDETPRHELTADMYADMVHILEKPAVQDTYRRVFWDLVRPMVSPILQNSAE